MFKTFLIIASLYTVTYSSFGQEIKMDTVKVATVGDTTNYFFPSGFYSTFLDDSKKEGFWLLNTDNYYFIEISNRVTLRHLDTIYKEFDENYNLYALTLKFDSVGTRELTNFSIKNQGRQIGLLLDERLVSISTIYSPISTGVMTIIGKFNETEIDKLRKDIQYAAKVSKSMRGTTKRKS
jgi:preprotein translocase subunit SecD